MKAAKLKIKRKNKAGRPRKENVERFPGGKVKPFETEKENQSVAIDARRRIHNMKNESDDIVKSPYAGYVLGRLFLDGKITKEQLEAGDEYATIIARYHSATGIPYPSARAQSLFSVKGHDGDVTDTVAARARVASNRMMEVQGVLLRCVDGPQVRTTIHNCVVLDLDHLRDMPPQQLLWLKRGLNAIKDRKQLQSHGKSVMTTDIPTSEMSVSV